MQDITEWATQYLHTRVRSLCKARGHERVEIALYWTDDGGYIRAYAQNVETHAVESFLFSRLDVVQAYCDERSDYLEPDEPRRWATGTND